MACFGKIEEGDILSLIQTNAAAADATDTKNILGAGAGSLSTIQTIIDALVDCLVDVKTSVGTSTLNSGVITINAPAGFTTANISGFTLANTGGGVELSITDTISDTGSSITYRLSGLETVDSGHELTVTFIRAKV